MNNRKLLAVTLPLIAATTVVGSGFAAWYFGQETKAKTGDIAVTVTEAITVGKLSVKYSTVDGALNQELDFGTKTLGLELDQGYKNTDDITKGIRFTIKDSTQTTAQVETLKSITYDYTIAKKDYENLVNAGYDIELTSSITFGEALFNYVEVKGDKEGSYTWATGAQYKKSGNTYSATNKVSLSGDNYTFSGEINFASSKEEGAGANTNNFKDNAMLNYIANGTGGKQGKPKTAEELKNMETALKDAKISLSFDENVI